MRPIKDLIGRIDEAIVAVSEDTCKGILAGYGGYQATGVDHLRRCYLHDMEIESYTQPSKWTFTVDSAYSLNRLCSKAPLDVYLRSVEIALKGGQAHYGLMFEALVHQLFHVPTLAVTFHVKSYSHLGDAAVVFESLSLGMINSVECTGKNMKEAESHLSTRKMDMSGVSYWYPDFPTFPVIDAVMCMPETKTVLYIQVTVAREHDLNFSKLTAIYELVRKSLKEVANSTEWKFKYITIGNNKEDAMTIKLMHNNKIVKETNIKEVSILTGYVTYV
jgi:hypothetical protein